MVGILGDDQIEVSIPGIEEPDLKRVKAIVRGPGVLHFRPLAERSKDPSMVAALTAVGDVVNMFLKQVADKS